MIPVTDSQTGYIIGQYQAMYLSEQGKTCLRVELNQEAMKELARMYFGPSMPPPCQECGEDCQGSEWRATLDPCGNRPRYINLCSDTCAEAFYEKSRRVLRRWMKRKR